MDLNDRLVSELIESVKQVLKRESLERLREVYLVGDIDKDSARQVIERMRELANENSRPITLYLNTAGGNVTDGLAIHDSIREIVSRGCEVTIVVQGMAYSMGSVVLQAASERLIFAAPAGSTPMTRAEGRNALMATATPARRPPPPTGT